MSTDSSGAGVNAVAIIAIIVLVLGFGYFMLRSGVLGGASSGPKLDVKVQTPAAPAPAPADKK